MSRFGPGVLPQDYRTVDPDGLISALAAYRGFKRGEAQDEIIQNQEARAAEKHDIDLYSSGYRHGPQPTVEQEVGGPGYTRPADSPLGPQGDPFAGLQRRGGPSVPAEPELDTSPFTPGQYLPGLGFQIIAPKIGLQKPATEQAPDPRYSRVSDDLYFDPSATREGKLQAALGRAGLTDVQSEIGSMRPELIDDFMAGPEPAKGFTVEDLIAAGLEPTDALLGARDPVFARQALAKRGGAPAYSPDDLKGAGLTPAEVAIVQADPSQLDNLLSLAERRRAANAREGRLSRGGGSSGMTPSQRRTAVMDAAKALFREMFIPEGSDPTDPGIVRTVAESMAMKFGVSVGDVQGAVSQAAQTVKTERKTPIGSPTRTGTAPGGRASEILGRNRTVDPAKIDSVTAVVMDDPRFKGASDAVLRAEIARRLGGGL